MPVQIVDGIRFHKTPATCFGQFADRFEGGDTSLGFSLLEVSEDDIAYTFVPLEEISERTDNYGPGGHPRPEERDYSLARERF